MVQTETQITQPNITELPEAGKHPLRNRLVVAVAVGAMSLSMTGCENPFGDSTADVVRVDELFPDAASKTAEHNDEPSFRATSVTILDGPSLIGSASLVKAEDGTYSLATVEHVARALYGLESNVDDSTKIINLAPKEAKQPLYDVPGIGLLSITAEQPDFVGAENPDTNGNVDRYTLIPLDTDQQSKLADAEKAGTIDVPEKAPLAGSFGDLVTMPLGETGESVPFVFLYKNEKNTKATLVPLYVLSQKLDYEEGMRVLNEQVELNSDRDAETTENYAADIAVSELESTLLARVKAGELMPLDAAKSLPCMGDSGSAFVNHDGNIIGTLSSGQPFYEFGKNYEEFDKFIINRDSAKPMVNRSCLSSVTISSPPA